MRSANNKKVTKPRTLCPGCEKSAGEDFVDAADRPWHARCARRALSEGFRTPLAPEDAAKTVSFESTEDMWRAPHSFHLREIIFCDDVELSGVYLGNKAMVYALQTPIRPRDLPERRLVIDHDFPLGMMVQMVGVPHGFKYRLIGERRRESIPPKCGLSARYMIAVGSLCTDAPVDPGEIAEMRFLMPAPFRGERVVCDDWQGWEIVDVRLGVDPGRSVQAQATRLTGHSTSAPSYTARVSEMITYEMRNVGDHPRKFDARVYGTLTL